jgi:4'-phosphopantetheinyl transferase
MPSQSFNARDEIHVWCIPLQGGEEERGLRHILMPDERDRADRFHFTEDCNRWIKSRSALRLILGRYLDTSPRDVRFVYGSHGKPSLDPGFHRRPLHFNLTHSADLALLAVTRAMPLGVDVECRRDIPDALQIAESYFCPDEIAELSILHRNEESDAFLRCWTRKEAYLKANGSGLSIPLNKVRVSLGENEPSRILLIDGSSQAAAGWRLYHLAPDPGYVGAVAVESETVANLGLVAFSFRDFTAKGHESCC